MDDKAGLACHGSPGKRGRDTDNEVEVGGPDAKNARTGDTNAEARNRTEAAASCYTDMNGTSSTTRRGNPSIPTVLDEVLGLPRGVFCKSLSFLADAEAPSELLEISVLCKSFRAAALDNILWKEMCDQKWKTKFGYQFRVDRAKTDAKPKDGDDISDFDRSVVSSFEIRPYPTAMSDDIDCPKAGFWYHRYWNELKMSTVNRITLSDLTEPRWSIATWFLPPNPKLLPTYAGTGLTRPTKNGLRFGADGSFAGPDGNKDVLISDFYALLDGGTIVNTAWPGIKSLQKTGAREADLDDLPESDILRQGCWLDQNTMFRSYIVGIPMRIVRWRAGHGKDKGLYHVKRDNVAPPPGMVERVWPFLQSLRDIQARAYSQWRQEFIELLEYLGKILLQDIAVLFDNLASSIVSCDPFNTDEYQEYRSELLESIASDESSDPSNFRHISLELQDVRSDVAEIKTMLVKVLEGRAQEPARRSSSSIRDYAVQRQPAAASASTLVRPIQRQQSAATSVGRSVSQVSVSSVYQNPNDTSTWRPRRPELPPFAANYEFLQYTSLKDLVEEYSVGSRGRPALKDIEMYFGPKKRGKSGKFPSWRSSSLRGSKKYDKRFCLNKNIYDLIDESKTVDQTIKQFEQMVHDNNPEMMQGPTNGKLVQWLIKYTQQNKDGYNGRRDRANAAHATKKRKREEMAREQAGQEDGQDE